MEIWELLMGVPVWKWIVAAAIIAGCIRAVWDMRTETKPYYWGETDDKS